MKVNPIKGLLLLKEKCALIGQKSLGGSPYLGYEVSHNSIKKWRRAWDLNPRNFRLPVFKTGALGRYASPPWERLPEDLGH